MVDDAYMAKMSNKVVNALKSGQAQTAEQLCRSVLNEQPSSPPFLRLMAHALLRQGKTTEAEKQLRFAIGLNSEFPPLYEDLGSILAQQKKYEEALELLEKAARLDPTQSEIHKKIGQVMAAMGRGKDADQSFQDYFSRDPEKEAIAICLEHIRTGRIEEAESALKKIIRSSPENVDALRLLAHVYLDQSKNKSDSEALLKRAVEIAPDFLSAWLDLGNLLQNDMRPEESIPCYTIILRHDETHIHALSGLASAYGAANYPDKALSTYKKLIKIKSDVPGYQMGYGHVLKTTGNIEQSISAYREAIRLKPDFGEVYWSLANLKVFKFDDHEISAMEHQLENNKDLDDKSYAHICFSLGKSFEDKKDYDQAWKYYHAGNEKNRAIVQYDPVQLEVMHEALMETFSKDFLNSKQDVGHDDPAPIFIVGLPRSGSTLIEQILASHSQVEGTAELSSLGKIAMSIGKYRSDGVRYPASTMDLRNNDFKAYGKEYLDDVKSHRTEGTPYFTDKLPNNFAHIGLLSVILPNAKIIDAKRHPLDSCLGAYKQLFAAGQTFTYDMFELGEYYKNYDRLMDHWNTVLPGKILRANYEDTVLDLEGQVRRILDHCGLPFEENCVNFHETKRAVLTASSEQVRQPIFKGGLGKWRKYEDHLEEWKYTLGDIIEQLPDTVKNAGL